MALRALMGSQASGRQCPVYYPITGAERVAAPRLDPRNPSRTRMKPCAFVVLPLGTLCRRRCAGRVPYRDPQSLTVSTKPAEGLVGMTNHGNPIPFPGPHR
eukprot:gene12962-biopygen508